MRRIIRVPVGLRLLRHDGDVSAASAACVTGCDSARRCEAARIVQVFTAASLGKSAFKVGQAEDKLLVPGRSDLSRHCFWG